MTDRMRARELAREAGERGETVEWFERLYGEAKRGDAVVPWADRVANPHLTAWLESREGHAGRALDVGCGYGDNAAALAKCGYEVQAFDVAPTAVEHARSRFGELADFSVQDGRQLPEAWRRRFDLVSEIYTLQAIPEPARGELLAALCEVVAPGGLLLLIARGRHAEAPASQPPWPLLRSELDAVLDRGFERVAFDEVVDDESPPVRRFVATYRRKR